MLKEPREYGLSLRTAKDAVEAAMSSVCDSPKIPLIKAMREAASVVVAEVHRDAVEDMERLNALIDARDLEISRLRAAISRYSTGANAAEEELTARLQAALKRASEAEKRAAVFKAALLQCVREDLESEAA